MYGCTLWQPSGIGFTRAIAFSFSQTILLRARAMRLVKIGSCSIPRRHLISKRNVVQMLGGSSEIGAGRHACDLAEVMAQMRLIVVAAFGGKIGPVHLLHAAQPGERVLEAPHTMKGLGRNAHLLVKELRHPALAHADLSRHCLHTSRSIADVQLAGHVDDRGMEADCIAESRWGVGAEPLFQA